MCTKMNRISDKGGGVCIFPKSTLVFIPSTYFSIDPRPNNCFIYCEFFNYFYFQHISKLFDTDVDQ